MMKAVATRFRAYQLGCPGSSFSYCAGGEFRMNEARLTDLSKASVRAEMKSCGIAQAASLDITSWDNDHCAASELGELLELIRPGRIETPGYPPPTDNAKEALALIREYKARQNQAVVIQDITPAYINGLKAASEMAFQSIIYHPLVVDPDHSNNNSTVKFYRSGSFNVLSLGDVQDSMISARLRGQKILKDETDLVILAHHGADNGFTNKSFIERVRPRLAICASNYDNQYDHPADAVRELLNDFDIPIFTTKTGDIIVESVGNHTGQYLATNWISDTEKVSSQLQLMSKKSEFLSQNEDTIRQRYQPRRMI
jgi:competence protein ComEC